MLEIRQSILYNEYKDNTILKIEINEDPSRPSFVFIYVVQSD